jgi:pyruvate dehydrogenase E2 component (dihydrolipoamide acetyltransferase)
LREQDFQKELRVAVIEVQVPDIGTDGEVEVIEVSVSPGDAVAAEQTIIVLESDKATVEVPCPQAGTVQSVAVKVGDKVRMGSPMLSLATAAAPPAKPATGPAAAKTAAPAVTPLAAQAPAAAETPATASAGGAMKAASREVTLAVPDLGGASGVEVIELAVKPGDTVAREQTLIVLESDKATMEVPAEAAGEVLAVLVKVGDKVSQGTPMVRLRVAGDVPVAAAAPAAVSAAVAASAVATAPSPAPTASAARTAEPAAPGAPVHAGPAVRKLARELGVNLAGVKGTGVKARITRDDVHAHVKQLLTQRTAAPAGNGLPELPVIDFAKWGSIEQQPLGKLRRLSARNLHRAWLHIPHVTQHDEADITELEDFRVFENTRLKEQGVKLTMLAFLVKACVGALKQYPKFNSSLAIDGESLVVKNYWHIGIAVDTPEGLVVPVIRDADRKGIIEIAREMGELSRKARDRKLTPADMQGATFSISSLGGIGGTAFTPIVNWPEVAILGVSKSQTKPHWNGKAFEPRLMLPLSLSYDHRVIDGADAARFVTYLSALLGDLRRLSL